MRVVKSDFIPDRWRPGKTTTVTSDWAPRITGGHATWMQRRGGKQWRRRKEAKKIKLRVATINVGTMTGKERKWQILWNEEGWTYCVCRKPAGRGREQVHRWRMWHCGSGKKKNGVEIILKKSIWTG